MVCCSVLTPAPDDGKSNFPTEAERRVSFTTARLTLEIERAKDVSLGVMAMAVAQFPKEGAWSVMRHSYTVEEMYVEILLAAKESGRLEDVSKRLYTASSERRSVDSADDKSAGSAYIRHVFMSYGPSGSRVTTRINK